MAKGWTDLGHAYIWWADEGQANDMQQKVDSTYAYSASQTFEVRIPESS